MQARAYARVQNATRRARAAAARVGQLESTVKHDVLRALAEALTRRGAEILEANDEDLLASAVPHAMPPEVVVGPERLELLAGQLRMLAEAADPIGEVLHDSREFDGVHLRQIRAPIGVLAVLFEDPVVLVRSAAMLFKAGSAAVLHHMSSPVSRTEAALMAVLHEVWEAHEIPVDSVALLCDDYRSTTRHLLNAQGEVDLVLPILPRPISPQLRAESGVPIADLSVGNCHVYVDSAASLPLAVDVVLRSKVPFMTTPSAVEQVLVHLDVAPVFIPRLRTALAEHDIGLRVDENAGRYAADAPREPASWPRGYRAPQLNCAVVGSIDEAIARINRFGAGHTEAVVTADEAAARRFSQAVDAAAVAVNTPTTFGSATAHYLDPDLGFSTNRLTPRGPLRLSELTSTKWLVGLGEPQFSSGGEGGAIPEVAVRSEPNRMPVAPARSSWELTLDQARAWSRTLPL